MADRDTYDGYVLQKVFPEPGALLRSPFPSLAETITDCDVVVDTNVLLLPYRAGASSLQEIRTVYTALQQAGRLFVPAQVAREFARNRATKLTEMYKALSDERSRPSKAKHIAFPLLEGLEAFAGLQQAANVLSEAVKSYQSAVDRVLSEVQGWGWNDPVAAMYREVLAEPDIVRDQSQDISEVRRELERRFSNKIPPGYKDGGKDDGGIGDFLIWLTILEIGRERRKPLVFVTGEEKADWQHRADNRGLMPRFELVDEYRRASGGQPFYLIQLSGLLALMNVGETVLTEIREEEDREREPAVEEVECVHCGSQTTWRLGRALGATGRPSCTTCGDWFFIHRTANGVISRNPTQRVQKREIVPEVVACPYCGDAVETRLGVDQGDSAAPVCEGCGERFHAHRSRSGVFSRRVGGVAPDQGLESGAPDQPE